MRNKSLLLTVVILNIAMCSLAQVSGTFKDSRDGKTYKTVKIGTQTWLANNLAFKASSGCYEYDNNIANSTTFGYLYTWETAKKVCPTGWHLPSMAEWTTLITNTGGENTAGKKLKEAGIKHWAEPNTGATNQSGFTALPGGGRQEDGQFTQLNVDGNWWTSDVRVWKSPGTGLSKTYCEGIVMKGDPDYGIEINSMVMTSSNNKECSYSVRCISNK
ncbi:MAG TPA: FISUMP domain-containing protein [Bacteroidales bacterium]